MMIIIIIKIKLQYTQSGKYNLFEARLSLLTFTAIYTDLLLSVEQRR